MGAVDPDRAGQETRHLRALDHAGDGAERPGRCQRRDGRRPHPSRPGFDHRGGQPHRHYPFPLGLAFLRDLTFRIGLCSIPRTWSQLVPLVQSGRIRPEGLITHRMGLSEAADAYRLFDSRADGVLKIVLDPTR